MNKLCTCGHHEDDHKFTPASSPAECQMPGCDCDHYEETQDDE